MYAVDIGDRLAVQTADDLPVRYAAALAGTLAPTTSSNGSCVVHHGKNRPPMSHKGQKRT
jgi:hypothetical protein